MGGLDGGTKRREKKMSKSLSITKDAQDRVIQAIETSTEPDSIELSISTKGIYSWTIKSYGSLNSFEDILAKIENVDKQLRKTYGGNDNNG